jgi:gliding motility-associated protein GldL
MNVGDFLHSRKWRTIQNYTYSFGASVVLIGALAKLEHWPAASGFLMTGLGMEALIFFISAFEPLLENPDWKRVYPQLREGDELPKVQEKYKSLDTEFDYVRKKTDGPIPTSGPGGGISFNDLPPEVVASLKKSFDDLSKAANEIKDISGATLATETFIKNLKEASNSIGSVVESNKKVSGEMEKNVSEITGSYKTAAQAIRDSSSKAATGIDQTVNEFSSSIKSTSETIKSTGDKVVQGVTQSINDLSGSVKSSADGIKSASIKFSDDLGKSSVEYNKQLQASANELSESYRKVTESLNGGFKGLERSSASYVEGIDKLNKNMAALNTAYELHLKGAGKIEEVVKQYSTNVAEIGKLLYSSVEETKKFNDNTKEINENIQALNKVYGRMLGALNTKK